MAPPPAPAASIPIPDELLEEIFIRLPTLDALACASAACTSFRRVIKGRNFRRRVRALHRAPLLGFMDAAGFCPAQAPHPSAPLAGALASCAADFSFVPPVVTYYHVPPGVQDDDEGPRWRPRDVRDGRVLLDWISLQPRVVSVRRYAVGGSQVRVLMGSSDHGYSKAAWTKRQRCNAAYFHLAVCDPLCRGFVLLPTIPEDLAAQPEDLLCEFHPVLAPATGDDGEEDLFKLTHTCKIGYGQRPHAVVEGREGVIEMFSLLCQHGSIALHHTSLQDNSDEWKLEKVIQLPGQYMEYSISTVGAAEGFLLFQGYPLGAGFENVDCYSMEVKTYEITKVCTKMEKFNDRKYALPYFSFPPVLSEPTI